MTISPSFHPDIQTTKTVVYDPCGFSFSELWEHEGKEYGACSFRLNDRAIQFRISKITPTKTGQFVTIWRRNQQGITQPFDVTDTIDFIVIASRKEDLFGLFIFPKNVLIDKEIISTATKEGKRGLRVYPPWDKTPNSQAEKTQKWQLDYFLEINNTTIDLIKAKKLFPGI